MQHPPSAIRDLAQLLHRNLAARELLFSQAVILLEGETELGVFPLWYDFARESIALCTVSGEDNFVPWLKLLRGFAIPWAILCDGEALWEKTQREGNIRRILGATTPLLPTANLLQDEIAFRRWREALQPYGIFTLAQTARDGFEKAVQRETSAEIWQEAGKRFEGNKVAIERFVADHCPCPPSVETIIRKICRHLSQQFQEPVDLMSFVDSPR